jgi:hypothetical protein
MASQLNWVRKQRAGHDPGIAVAVANEVLPGPLTAPVCFGRRGRFGLSGPFG